MSDNDLGETVRRPPSTEETWERRMRIKVVVLVSLLVIGLVIFPAMIRARDQKDRAAVCDNLHDLWCLIDIGREDEWTPSDEQNTSWCVSDLVKSSPDVDWATAYERCSS